MEHPGPDRASCRSRTAWTCCRRSGVPEYRPVLDPARLIGVELDGAPHDDAGAERDVPVDHQPLGLTERRWARRKAGFELVDRAVELLVQIDEREPPGALRNWLDQHLAGQAVHLRAQHE